MRRFLTCTLLVTSSVLGIARVASAEHLVDVATARDGVVYQIDLDSRNEYTSKTGWRHVEFMLSTRGDTHLHSAIAACSPYDVKSPYYNWDWKPDGGGFTEGTIAGDISRAACDL